MAPACSKAALRVLTSVLLVSGSVSAVALRPVAVAAEPSVVPDSIDDSRPDPKYFFKDLGAFLSDYSPEDVLRYLFGKIVDPGSLPQGIEVPASLPVPEFSTPSRLVTTPVGLFSSSLPSFTPSLTVASVSVSIPTSLDLPLTTLVPSLESLSLDPEVTLSTLAALDFSGPPEELPTDDGEMHIEPFPFPIETTAVEIPVDIQTTVTIPFPPRLPTISVDDDEFEDVTIFPPRPTLSVSVDPAPLISIEVDLPSLPSVSVSLDVDLPPLPSVSVSITPPSISVDIDLPPLPSVSVSVVPPSISLDVDLPPLPSVSVSLDVDLPPLPSVLVSVALPSISIDLDLPTLPSVSASLALPTISLLSAVPSVSALIEPAVSIDLDLPSVSPASTPSASFSLDLSLPPLPSLSVSVEPSISIDVVLPSIPTLSLLVPSVSVASIAALLVEPISVSIPSISVPSVSIPSGSIPSVSIDSVSIDSVSIDSGSIPSVSIDSVSIPSVSAPSVTLSIDLELPSLPAVSVLVEPSISLDLDVSIVPSVSVSIDLELPSMPSLSASIEPSISLDLELPPLPTFDPEFPTPDLEESFPPALETPTASFTLGEPTITDLPEEPSITDLPEVPSLTIEEPTLSLDVPTLSLDLPTLSLNLSVLSLNVPTISELPSLSIETPTLSGLIDLPLIITELPTIADFPTPTITGLELELTSLPSNATEPAVIVIPSESVVTESVEIVPEFTPTPSLNLTLPTPPVNTLLDITEVLEPTLASIDLPSLSLSSISLPSLSIEVPSVQIFPYPLLNSTGEAPVPTPTFVLPLPSLGSPSVATPTATDVDLEEDTETIVFTLPSPTASRIPQYKIEIVPFSVSRPVKNVTISRPLLTATIAVLPTPTLLGLLNPSTLVPVVSPSLGLPSILNATELNTTITLQSTSLLYITKTVTPVLVTSIGALSLETPLSVPSLSIPTWTNSSELLGTGIIPSIKPPSPTPAIISGSFEIFGTITAPLLEPLETVTAPILVPIPSSAASAINSSVTVIPTPRRSLLQVCRNPAIKVITLPLLTAFYGPNAYPALNPFPGCSPSKPDSSQAIRAPGLLNCTSLGQEVQACQSLGKKVLLSVKASGAASVAGNLDYGKPGTDPEPFGPNFGDIGPGGVNTSIVRNKQPNLFDEGHPPSSFALTIFSLFGEGHTERADLRPLGPDAPSAASPDGKRWWNRPLGEEVVVDGFDIRVPSEWKGRYQAGQFQALVKRLRELNDEAWTTSGGVTGASSDLGADGKGVVVLGWI